MCTVSWLTGPDGYTLCFNRDERFTRAPAVPPALRARDGVRFLAPLDGDAGGTWFSVNEFGLTLGLLNRYGVTSHQPRDNPRSRGLLVLDLASAPTVPDALARLTPYLLSLTQPFTLIIAEPGQPAGVTTWDGGELATVFQAEPGFLRTSSSVTEPEVAESRRALFAASAPYTAESLAALHRSHVPERGRRSVCMHREDAETQSYSEAIVGRDSVTLRHVPDAPCRGQPLPLLTLSRRLLPCPLPE